MTFGAGGRVVCVCVVTIRQPVQFSSDDHDTCYLLSHRAHAEPSAAVVSQLSTPPPRSL